MSVAGQKDARLHLDSADAQGREGTQVFPMTPVQIDAILRLLARENGLHGLPEPAIIDDALTPPVVRYTKNAKRPYITLPKHHVLVRLDRSGRAVLTAMAWGSASLRESLLGLEIVEGLRKHFAKRAKNIRRSIA